MLHFYGLPEITKVREASSRMIVSFRRLLRIFHAVINIIAKWCNQGL